MGFIIGLWNQLVSFLAQALLFFQGITGSYGLAIILLTVIVRLALSPLSVKQARSMKQMQRVQPEIKRVQKKHKDDKKKQQEELMKVYQKHDLNPLGGCLPLLLQFPVFIALYSVLRYRSPGKLKKLAITMPALAKTGVALNQGAPFLGINLGKSFAVVAGAKAFSGAAILKVLAAIPTNIPHFILIILMIVTQFFYSKHMGGSDKSQAATMNMMLIFFVVLAVIFPAGLILYFIITNLIGIMEHVLIVNRISHAEPVKQGASK